MRMFDITKKLTEYVGKYIAEGYVISNTMAGHEGEVNKVDLVKGEELIRVWINEESDWSDVTEWQGVKIILRVSRWRYPFKTKYCSVWNSDMNTVESITYYPVDKGDWYFDNLEEAIHYQRVHNSRSDNKFNPRAITDITSPETLEIAVKYFKRKGLHIGNLDGLKVFRRYVYTGRNQYVIKHYGKPYYIN